MPEVDEIPTDIWKLPRVRVTKVSSHGERTPDTLAESYTLEGFELALPKIGETYRVFRTVRNGVHVLGHFETSRVKAVLLSEDNTILETENSRWRVTYLGPGGPGRT